MFTGIIETTGLVKEVVIEGSNRRFRIASPLSDQLKVDQSLAHDGVCLTVEEVNDGSHLVTAVAETLQKTNLEQWQPGRRVNLERSLQVNSRLDGHFVQGHVDATATCKQIVEKDGSHELTFGFDEKWAPLLIEKGSISVNGISLTAFDVKKNEFRVAIIPYTWEHTNLKALEPGQLVNLEFDMLGKYIVRHFSLNPAT